MLLWPGCPTRDCHLRPLSAILLRSRPAGDSFKRAGNLPILSLSATPISVGLHAYCSLIVFLLSGVSPKIFHSHAPAVTDFQAIAARVFEEDGIIARLIIHRSFDAVGAG